MGADIQYELDERGFLVDLQELKKSYRLTLRTLMARRRELEEYIEQTSGMTLEEMGEKKHRKVRDQWKQMNDSVWNELQDIKEMISDVNFAIEWLHTGRQPSTKRGIDRRSVYQNTVLMDPMIMANFSNAYNSRSSTTLTPEESDRLRDALAILSPREQEIYVMAHGKCFSHDYIAQLLGITKSSVDTYVKRAHEKLSNAWQGTLF